MENGIFLLLGTNQGNRGENLEAAGKWIGKQAGKIIRFSGIYKTAAWGKTDQPEFYNQVIEIETSLAPEQLLHALLQTEAQMGRERIEKWGPRIIDIDILFYNQHILNSSHLTLPHPGIPDRKFTLVPLAEIAPEFHHPVLRKTISTLLKECTDPLPVSPAFPNVNP